MRLSRVIVFSKDCASMERFYVEALGLEPVPESRAEGWVELWAGEVTIALHAIPPDIAPEVEISSPPAAREETPLKMVFEVEDPDGVRSRIAACGGVTIGGLGDSMPPTPKETCFTLPRRASGGRNDTIAMSRSNRCAPPFCS